MSNNFWDERYGQKEYIYGETPNVFFAGQLDGLPPGKILLPCDGEGRNGVYASAKGWKVDAFDMSEAGKIKALALAAKHKTSLTYTIADAAKVQYPENSFDLIAFIYAHFPLEVRNTVYRNAITWLKPGGLIIGEVFNMHQLQNSSGGPKDPDMLYTEPILKGLLNGLQIVELTSTETSLNEGKYHEGKADVIRFVAMKQIP